MYMVSCNVNVNPLNIHCSMNRPKIEFIAYLRILNILIIEIIYNLGGNSNCFVFNM